MTNKKSYAVSHELANSALVDNDKYLQMYQQSIDNPITFWGEQGKRLD